MPDSSTTPNETSPSVHRRTVLGVTAAGAALGAPGAIAAAAAQDAADQATPDATGVEPPAFEDPLTDADVAGAARTVDLDLDAAEIAALVPDLQRRRAQIRRRRARRLPNEVAPAQTWRPVDLADALPVNRTPETHTATGDHPADASAPGAPATPAMPATPATHANPAGSIRATAALSHVDPGPLPDDPGRIAHAPVTHLAAWIRRGELTSRKLTDLYLERIERLDPKLEAIITTTTGIARQEADQADRELAAGTDRGVLHGIPYGAKDLFDVVGNRTTWGAAPYRDRIAPSDAAVVKRLRDAGAVLVAKTSLGALAYGDIWFGGRTNNPWDVRRGSSGSSAGSAAGIAAGLFAFSLGTETYGSIVSPSMECGTTGLRPTFGRVPRTGAMALCWSLDKVGPICRTVEDCGHVLRVINGADAGDPSSIDLPFEHEPAADVRDLTVGYDPRWFTGRRVSATDQAGLDAMKAIAARDDGPTLVEIEGPSPDGAGELLIILETEAAAAFQELTLDDRDDELTWQAPQAWPQTFRGAHFHSAVDLMQAMRMRRVVSERMHGAFQNVDVMISPSFAGGLNLMTNFTGHPCLVLRSGFADSGRPSGISLFGRLGHDADLVHLGARLESELGVAGRTPPDFT